MDPHHVGYNEAQGRQFYQELLRRVRALPEVESAGLAISGPLSAFPLPMQVQPEGYAPPKGQSAPTVFSTSFPQAFFDTLRIPVVRGRPFLRVRRARTRRASRLSTRRLAERFWPGQDPIGKKIQRLRPIPAHRIQVVGVLKRRAIPGHHPSPSQPYIYSSVRTELCAHSDAARSISMARQKLRPAEVLKEISKPGSRFARGRRGDHAPTNRQLSVRDSWGYAWNRDSQPRWACSALSLALLGLYGVVSYSAAQRTHEIGVRLTLGASPRRYPKAGSRPGTPDCWHWTTGRFRAVAGGGADLRALVLDVSATDPPTLAGVAVLLACVTLAACYIPARRAMRADPTVALNE